MQPCDTIGSHLCERLLAEGNDIICIDNYFTGHKSNIRHLLSHPNFEVIRHDIVYPYMAEIEEIYGDPLIHPQREDYWGHVNPLGIRSCYDEGRGRDRYQYAEVTCTRSYGVAGVDYLQVHHRRRWTGQEVDLSQLPYV